MTTKESGSFSNNQRSRWIEDALAVAGGVAALLYILGVETFPTVCYSLGRCTNQPVEHPFPWGVCIIVTVCIMPKTLGRVTAGRVWDAIGSRFGGRPPTPPEAG